jgi:hypothetical protein
MGDPSVTKYPDLAPAKPIQKTRFVDCDITYIDGAESVENCRVIAWAKLANPNNGMGYPKIHNVNSVSGLEVKHVPGNYKLSIKNCNTVVGVNANNFIVEYDGCANIGATQGYVDEAVAKASGASVLDFKDDGNGNVILSTKNPDKIKIEMTDDGSGNITLSTIY